MKIARVLIVFLVFISSQVKSLTDVELNAMQAKAIFLYNFANFVDWPEDAFSSPTSPIRICLYGDVPFGIFLDAVEGTIIENRKLTVIRTKNIEDIYDGCQILFVGQDKHERLPDFWNKIKYFYVLSVGEQEKFADRGGIINILRTTDRVQFQINISNALAQGLFLSSDLLSLAREIKRNTETPQE